MSKVHKLTKFVAAVISKIFQYLQLAEEFDARQCRKFPAMETGLMTIKPKFMFSSIKDILCSYIKTSLISKRHNLELFWILCPSQQGFEYTNCIPCKQVRPPPHMGVTSNGDALIIEMSLPFLPDSFSPEVRILGRITSTD